MHVTGHDSFPGRACRAQTNTCPNYASSVLMTWFQTSECTSLGDQYIQACCHGLVHGALASSPHQPASASTLTCRAPTPTHPRCAVTASSEAATFTDGSCHRSLGQPSELKLHVLCVAQRVQVCGHGLVHRRGPAASNEHARRGRRQVRADHLRGHEAHAARPARRRLV